MHSKPLIATAPSAKTDELINELHLWAVHEGLRRTPTATSHWRRDVRRDPRPKTSDW
jgi:hypothetical protein